MATASIIGAHPPLVTHCIGWRRTSLSAVVDIQCPEADVHGRDVRVGCEHPQGGAVVGREAASLRGGIAGRPNLTLT